MRLEKLKEFNSQIQAPTIPEAWTNFQKMLATLLGAGQKIYLEGKPGFGKTSLARSFGAQVVHGPSFEKLGYPSFSEGRQTWDERPLERFSSLKEAGLVLIDEAPLTDNGVLLSILDKSTPYINKKARLILTGNSAQDGGADLAPPVLGRVFSFRFTPPPQVALSAMLGGQPSQQGFPVEDGETLKLLARAFISRAGEKLLSLGISPRDVEQISAAVAAMMAAGFQPSTQIWVDGAEQPASAALIEARWLLDEGVKPSATAMVASVWASLEADLGSAGSAPADQRAEAISAIMALMGGNLAEAEFLSRFGKSAEAVMAEYAITPQEIGIIP